MDFKKLVPWNWFKSEEEQSGTTVPVQHTAGSSMSYLSGPIGNLQQEVDKLFNDMFEDLGFGSFSREKSLPGSITGDLLRPRVDVGASDKEYSVSIEIPGVDQKDIKLEILDNSLIVRGEKKQEKEEKEKNFYRMERSYGAFQRILALPDDANQDEVQATFKNGVLTVSMPKKPLPNSAVRQIDIQ